MLTTDEVTTLACVGQEGEQEGDGVADEHGGTVGLLTVRGMETT